MALNNYAVLDEDNKVIDFIEFDVMDFDTPSPYPNFNKVKIIEEFPQIGWIWNGETFINK